MKEYSLQVYKNYVQILESLYAQTVHLRIFGFERNVQVC
jgi:hypothetical protein